MAPGTRVAWSAGLAALGVACIFSPDMVGDLLGRPATTTSEAINLRATWGGALLGLAGCFAFVPALRPRGPLLVGVLVWVSYGVSVGRVVGFVLDGEPDQLQWLWLIAELLIALLGGIWLARRRGRESS